MFEGPFYRVGNTLVNNAGVVIFFYIGEYMQNKQIKIHVPHIKDEIEIYEKGNKDEFDMFMKLYDEANHVIMNMKGNA